MIRSFCTRGVVISKFFRGSGKATFKEPSTPSKKKFSYLWISLHSRRLLLLVSRFQRWGDGHRRKDICGGEILGVSVQTIMERIGLGQLKNLKRTVLMLGLVNLIIFVIAILVAFNTAHGKCPRNVTLAAAIMGWAAGMRIIWMVGMGFTQAGFASTMSSEDEGTVPPSGQNSSIDRRQRRVSIQILYISSIVLVFFLHRLLIRNSTRRYDKGWYRRWLWWSRVGIIISVLQGFGTSYFSWFLARNVHILDRHVTICQGGEGRIEEKWVISLMFALPILGGIILFAQCCIGSDVLAWRLLYGAHYEAWRAHYRQMFDYGIREVLCCLGRGRYMSVREEDEVDSVATLLGDLLEYRAAGASHLEVIAGVALLREGSAKMSPLEEFEPAPDVLLTEAALLHPYAEAAYTGPLLDVGRNFLTFPCAWLYRQGVLTPWNRNRWPALEGDNWWRGHAAAFLRSAQLPPEALRQGRVLQTNREAAYFVAVLQQLQIVLVAIRGTETPEDLLTDILGREVPLTKSDLRGILHNCTISDGVKQKMLATMPHFGHKGIIEAARELALQLDNLAEGDEIAEHPAPADIASNSESNKSMMRGARASLSSTKRGLLSSLLGPDGECEGFSLRLVGHSLGGSIAALTGLRLASTFPNLHVYAFGVLPCVDLITAEACSTFTTSVINNDEFSSRLSVAAITRLRIAALEALASDSNTDAALVTKLTRRLFKPTSQADLEVGNSSEGPQRRHRQHFDALKGGAFLCSHVCRCIVQMSKHSSSRQPNGIQLASISKGECRDFESQFLKDTWNGTCQVTVAEPSRNNLDYTENEGGAFYEQLLRDKAVNGVSLADGEALGIDAGTEIVNEEEAESLMKDSETDMQGQVGDGLEDLQGSRGLLDSGTPKEITSLFPGSHVEMFVPGVVIHVVRTAGNSKWFALPRTLSFGTHLRDDRPRYTAVLKDRKLFRDIVVSPAMFLDHMPWKCQYALNDIVEQLGAAKQRQGSSSVESITNV